MEYSDTQFRFDLFTTACCQQWSQTRAATEQ